MVEQPDLPDHTCVWGYPVKLSATLSRAECVYEGCDNAMLMDGSPDQDMPGVEEITLNTVPEEVE